MLKQHKIFSKSLTKDRSQSAINLSLRQTRKDLRGWLETAERLGGEGSGLDALAEALVGRLDGEGRGRAIGGTEEEQEREEEEAPGVLVPVSKKKRAKFASGSVVHPPESLLALYGPLLKSLAKAHATFATVLSNRFAKVLDASTSATPSSIFTSSSYIATLSAWFVWTYDELLPSSSSLVDGINGSLGYEKDAAVKQLVQVAWGNENVVRILRALEGRDEGLGERLGGLLEVLGGTPRRKKQERNEDEDEIDEDVQVRVFLFTHVLWSTFSFFLFFFLPSPLPSSLLYKVHPSD